MAGTGATIKNGTVGTGRDVIHLLDGGEHTVKNIVFLGGDGTVGVQSNNNRLINNTIFGAIAGALIVQGNDNKVAGNTVECASLLDSCVSIGGTGNTVTDNEISSPPGPPTAECSLPFSSRTGIAILGDTNRVRKNLITIYAFGIRVDGSENVVDRNTAFNKAVLISLTPLATVPIIPGETIRL